MQMVMSLALLTLALLASLGDMNAVAAWSMYFVARQINIQVMRRRQSVEWKGKKEPGAKSDLLILLSNDRWVRVQGRTDDVKVVTSGAWLRDPTLLERMALTSASIMIFVNAGVIGSATREGQMLLMTYMLASTFLLEICNELNDELRLLGRTIIVQSRKAYERRLYMADELVEEVGRDDWCAKMGIILEREKFPGKRNGPVIM